jgi:hypothetical protein
MLAEAGAAFSSIKIAMDMAKGLGALKSEADVNQAVIDIQRVLLEAQSGALEDKQRIAELSDRLAQLQRAGQSAELWNLEKQRYVLTKSPLGAFTYDLRPEMANGEVLHRLCATCVEAGRKSILHTSVKHSGGEIVFCQFCKSELTLCDFQVTVGSY